MIPKALRVVSVIIVMFELAAFHAFGQTPFGDGTISPPIVSSEPSSRNSISEKSSIQSNSRLHEYGRVYISPVQVSREAEVALPAKAARQLQITIPEFIRKICGVFGINLPKKVAIKIGSSSTKPVPNQGTGSSGLPSSKQTAPTGDIATLKRLIQVRFGIKTLEGSNTTWSKRQLEETFKVLNSLPASFRWYTKNLQRDAMFQNSPNILGWVQMGVPTVHITNAACREGIFQGTIVHEMTHCFQAANPEIAQKWEAKFWPWGKLFGPRPPSVSEYGNSQPMEDMAESVRAYWANGPLMKVQQPERYEFIRKYVMGGVTF